LHWHAIRIAGDLFVSVRRLDACELRSEPLRFIEETIMPILSQPSPAARTSLMYITIGALTDVWSGIWFVYLRQNSPENHYVWYFCYGFLLTGLTLVVIGLAIGRIGRSARHAELPPEEVTAAVAQVDQNAAARAPMIAPMNPALPINPAGVATLSNGTVVAPASAGANPLNNGAVVAPAPVIGQTPRIS
jgi:hypothetical protein